MLLESFARPLGKWSSLTLNLDMKARERADALAPSTGLVTNK